MRLISIFPALTLLILAGCGGGSSEVDTTIGDTIGVDETVVETTPATDIGSPIGSPIGGPIGGPISAPELLLARFSGATFVAVGADQSAVDSPSDVGSVSFTNDTVTWTRSETVVVDSFVSSQSSIVEVGSYVDDGSDELVASFADRDIAFESDNGNLIWDSLNFRRAAGSQLDSQETLVDYLDSSTFISNQQFDIAGGRGEDQGLASWVIRFEDDEVFWAERGEIVVIGTLSFVDDSTFRINFASREVTVVALSRDELVIDAVIYEKEQTNQFDSQETLVEFLDGASFRSTSLQTLGETSSGISAIGYWFVDFVGETFSWAYQDGVEAGTVSFIDTNRFSAELTDRTLIVEVEGDEILWDGVRYSKVIGE